MNIGKIADIVQQGEVMLNKKLCAYCLYQQLVKRYQDNMLQLKQTKKMKLIMAIKLKWHDRYFGKWLKTMLEDSAGLIPCFCDVDAKRHHKIAFYVPLDLGLSYTEAKESPEDCPFILEHTLFKRKKK